MVTDINELIAEILRLQDQVQVRRCFRPRRRLSGTIRPALAVIDTLL